ncbi:hypothetical protein GCM10023334_017340 [Nonomuraea thailandensis]
MTRATAFLLGAVGGWEAQPTGACGCHYNGNGEDMGLAHRAVTSATMAPNAYEPPPTGSSLGKAGLRWQPHP